MKYSKSIKINLIQLIPQIAKQNRIKLEIDSTVVKFNFKRENARFSHDSRSLRGAADCSWPVFPVARYSRATNRERVAY